MAEEMLRVEEGSLYPALYRWEERGWIESEWGTSENNRRAASISSRDRVENNFKLKKRTGSGSSWSSVRSCNPPE